MRCPTCNDEYERDVRDCARCRTPLVPAAAPATSTTTGPVTAEQALDTGDPQIHLGRFHPAVAERITAVLAHRRIGHRILPSDDHVTVHIDASWRDDVRTELMLTWAELVRRLEPEVITEVLALGGSTPGWFDAPRGGHIDRAGRLVVDAGDGEDRELDGARVLGPSLLTVGAILIVLGWQVTGSDLLVVLGLGMVVLGLFLPR